MNRNQPVTMYALISGFLFLFCAHPLDTIQKIYEPQVVFVGTVIDDYDSLPGNLQWPNTCTMRGDTVCMTFFSKDFARVNNIWQGDLIRIEVLPCSTCTTGIFSTRNIIFHMARYASINFTWEIVPKDTVSTNNSILLHSVTFSRRPGDAIEFKEIGATAKALTGSQELTIKEGRIFGSIE